MAVLAKHVNLSFEVAQNKSQQFIAHSNNKQHYYISDEIFANVVKKISDIAATIVGANKIVLYAVPSALGFYERNGFSSFLEYMEPDHTAYLDGCIPMYLDI